MTQTLGSTRQQLWMKLDALGPFGFRARIAVKVILGIRVPLWKKIFKEMNTPLKNKITRLTIKHWCCFWKMYFE